MSAPGRPRRWFERTLDLGLCAEGEFIHCVRGLAADSLGPLVSATATWSTDHADCLIVVEFPWLPAGGRLTGIETLQVNWSSGRLAGSWAGRSLWDDDDPRDDDALLVQGVDLSDHDAADAAVEWLSRELSRPVEHQTWTVRDRVVAQRWLLTDTGRTLVSRGIPLAPLGPPQSRSLVNTSTGAHDDV